MIIKKIHLQNIRSYENLEMEFEQGSTLLSGTIGSGKTSILLGIQFALFGLQPGQKGSSILRSGESEAYARIEIEIDGEVVNIERTIKKSKAGSITQDKNILTTKDERVEMSTSEMKNKVISLLNYPKEFAKKSNLLYKFTVYTPQEEMKNIIEERPEIRLDTIRHIFGIDRYKRIKDNTEIVIQKIKESVKIKEVLTAELGLLKEKLKIETENKIQLAREVNNYQIEFKKAQEEIELEREKKQELEVALEKQREIEQQIIEKKATVEGKIALESRLKKEMAAMQKENAHKVDFSYERLKSVEDLLFKHRKILDEKNEVYLDVQQKISGLEAQKEKPMHMKEKVTSIENCPTCHQLVSHEHKEKISKITDYELEDIARELEQKLMQKTKVVQEIEAEKKLVTEYTTDLEELQKNKVTYEHQKTIETKIKSDSFVLDRTSNEIRVLQEEVTSLSSQISKTHKEAYARLTQSLELLEADLRRDEIRLATKEKELELVKKGLDDLSSDIAKKDKVKEDLVYLRELQDWLKEKFLSMITITEKNVLSKIKNEFSEIFSDWFNMLVTSELRVRLDEDFTPIITNQDYDMDYNFLSGGERTAVALSYRLALNQVLTAMLSKIKTKDIVILDEPTDGFATEQIDKMRDLFDQLNSKQLIIVSHEEKMEGFVDHVIKIAKEGSSTSERIFN